jgi:hypothetical protein
MDGAVISLAENAAAGTVAESMISKVPSGPT